MISAYLTIEDNDCNDALPSLMPSLVEEYTDRGLELTIQDNYDNYTVIRIEYEDIGDVMDFVSNISSVLMSESIYSFSFTYRDASSLS